MGGRLGNTNHLEPNQEGFARDGFTYGPVLGLSLSKLQAMKLSELAGIYRLESN